MLTDGGTRRATSLSGNTTFKGTFSQYIAHFVEAEEVHGLKRVKYSTLQRLAPWRLVSSARWCKFKAWAIKARNRMLSLIAPGAFEVDGSYTRKDIVRILKDNVAIVWLEVPNSTVMAALWEIHTSRQRIPSRLQAKCIQEGYGKPYFGKTKQQWVAEDCKLNEFAEATSATTALSPEPARNISPISGERTLAPAACHKIPSLLR